MQRRCFADETLSCPELYGNQFTNLKRYIIIKSLCFDITQPKEENLVLVTLIESVYNFLWGDLLTLPLGGVTLNLSLMVILLFTAGIYFTLRTRLLPMRLFRDMLDAVCEKKQGKQGGLSSLPDAGGLHRYPGGHGQSGGRGGGGFRGWCRAPCSGCGSRRCWGRPPPLWSPRWRRNIRQPDPLYGGWRGGPALLSAQAGRAQAGETAQTICVRPRCSRCPASSAGAASARLSATR